MAGSTEETLLQDAGLDVCHARFAYFFVPRCLPGLAELSRVMRPKGTAFIIDNDFSSGTFRSWLQFHPHLQGTVAGEVESFWGDQGFTLTRVPSCWRFESRGDLEAVILMEFGRELGARLLADHLGNEVDYHYCLDHRRY